ncbi:hypothetical protein H6503_02310 [Candidatus Woesearchaeota archaeon]|nr:hypothetical protein [Candidatus Woesearchaeota archaeon]
MSLVKKLLIPATFGLFLAGSQAYAATNTQTKTDNIVVFPDTMYAAEAAKKIERAYNKIEKLREEYKGISGYNAKASTNDIAALISDMERIGITTTVQEAGFIYDKLFIEKYISKED